MFTRIDHIEVVTARPERAVAFYTDVLGFRVRERQRVPATPLGPLELVYLELGGTTVEVMCYPEANPPAREEGERLGWRLLEPEGEDMDAAGSHRKGRGIEASWGPRKTAAYARAEIRDPEGNSIELRQWIR